MIPGWKDTEIVFCTVPQPCQRAASGVARAEAMAYRDASREGMTERDWAEIERQLLRAYQLLKAGIDGS